MCPPFKMNLNNISSLDFFFFFLLGSIAQSVVCMIVDPGSQVQIPAWPYNFNGD